MSLNKISEQLLLAVKTNQTHGDFLFQLDNYSLDQLEKNLNNDEAKKAFWINIYNAFFQIFRKVHQLDKPEIYKEKLINIAGEKLSLDDVEHGILRKYRYKYSLGFLPNFFTKNLIKKWAVNKIDYRIHFALNCGAKSCPPIAFYSLEKIDAQLQLATDSFLEGETDVLEEKKEIHITQLFKWFLADFGGKSGIRKILKEHLEIDSEGYNLVFKPYSWEEELANYSDDFSS
ncbi:MAG: DUF547 domain-containing protein [Saprospiraceae bacterium]